MERMGKPVYVPIQLPVGQCGFHSAMAEKGNGRSFTPAGEAVFKHILQ
jgi:hypothetical protein